MPKSNQSTRLKVLKPRLKICVFCRGRLKLKYQQDVKTVYELMETVKFRRYAYHCVNITCRRYPKPVISPRKRLNNHSIGYSLLHYIGTSRVHQLQTLTQIRDDLSLTHGIKLCRKTVSNLSDKFLQLISNKPHQSVINNLRSRGNCIISIDGIKPQKANTTLYLIREELSDEILLARVVVNSATKFIVPLFEEIKKCIFQLQELSRINSHLWYLQQKRSFQKYHISIVSSTI